MPANIPNFSLTIQQLRLGIKTQKAPGSALEGRRESRERGSQSGEIVGWSGERQRESTAYLS